MKKTLVIILSLFAFSTLMAKKSPFVITFGNGGGFTGLTATYTLHSDRTFFKTDNVAHKQVDLGKVKPKDIAQVKKLLKQFNFAILNINQMGNMTNFITLLEDGKESKTQWTGSTSGNPALDALNSKLVSLISHK